MNVFDLEGQPKMLTTVGATIDVQHPTPALIEYCEKNLVIPNPEYAKKKRMGFWTGNTAKTIQLYDIVGETYVIPYGCLYEVFPIIKQRGIISAFRDIEKHDYGVDIDLYGYQENAVEIMKQYAVGILQSEAGSGKTRMGLAIIAGLQRRALWITHTLDLVKQAHTDALELGFKPNDLAEIKGGKVEISKGITFATIQTLANVNLDKYKNYWDIVIVDEVHRVASSGDSLTRYEKVLNQISARHKFGLSATVHRADGLIKTTFALMGGVAHKVDKKDIADKIMSVKVRCIPTDFRLNERCIDTSGMINHARLISELTKDEERNKLIVDLLKKDKRPTLVLSNRVEHLKHLRELVGRGEIMAGRMSKKERERIIAETKSGKNKLLFATYQLCQEGLDIPRLEHLYYVTPIKDYAQVVQSIGRVARTHNGKQQPMCFDIADTLVKYLAKNYRNRRSIYRKIGCEVIEDEC